MEYLIMHIGKVVVGLITINTGAILMGIDRGDYFLPVLRFDGITEFESFIKELTNYSRNYTTNNNAIPQAFRDFLIQDAT